MKTKIVSFGKYYPNRVVTNKELETLMNTSDDWIVQRTGICERRWAEPGETSSGMAVKASQEALKTAGLSPDDIDMIIYACLISDYPFPGSGPLVQHQLGFSKPIPSIDIRSQCAGWLYSMSVADAWIRAGCYKRILIIGSELQSTSLDMTPRGRENSILFGDAAAACIVEATEVEDDGVIDTILFSEGQYAEKLGMLKPSPNDFPRLIEGEPITDNIYGIMDGRFVFQHAINRMAEALSEVCERNQVQPSDLDFLIAHQANRRIIEMIMKQFELPASKTHYTLDRFGNTTAASIPLTMQEAIELGKIKRGDLVAQIAFGSGFVWGATLLKY